MRISLMAQYNPNLVENEILKFWEKNKTFDKLRKKNQNSNKVYSFLDGPITANNSMGVHHAWGRTLKDFYQRYHAMHGYDERYQNGFDCQGLWVEVEVEKDLGLNSKQDIRKFGLNKFSTACKNRVEKYSKLQTEQSIKLGQWMDWDNSYYTMSETNNVYIWHFLKTCFEKGWLYKGTHVMPWCTRCGTALSQHELSDGGYKDLVHKTIYVTFPVEDKKNEYFLVWTTTPWTLSSNTALAVHAKLDYVRAKKGDKVYYLAKKVAEKIGGFTVLDVVKGKDLIGMKYDSMYPEFTAQKDANTIVIEWDQVGEEEGTGIVHIAPGCGEADHDLGMKNKLKAIAPLDEFGVYLNGFGFLTGKNVHKVQDEVFLNLEEKGYVFKIDSITHRYPCCWRCGTECVFRLVDEWFISVNEIRSKMKEAAKTITWEPDYVGKRMQDWLDNMGDWIISRKRFWGLALPFFECSCGEVTVVGSKDELRKLAIDPKLVDDLPSLHRPWIDKIKIKCKCGEEVERIADVGDCWLDAGIVPFSTLNYLEDKEYWRKWFPIDLICEGRAQVRLWFYSLLFMSVTLEGVSPYKSVKAFESVVAEDGRQMHKSWGNAIWFDDAVEKIGADVMRYMYSLQNPTLNMKFGYNLAKEAKRDLDVIWNLGFYIQQNCDSFDFNENLELEDKWILSRLEGVKKNVQELVKKLEHNVAIAEIKDFLLNNLSREYVQYIRNRIGDKNVQGVLYKCYYEGLLMLAPFLPFITEKLYQELFRKKENVESIHLVSWPATDLELHDASLEEQMKVVQDIVQKGLARRDELALGLRWPLHSLILTTKETKDFKKFKNLFMSLLNVKDVEFKDGEFSVDFDSKLTPELEREGFAREIIRRIQNLRKKEGLVKDDNIKLLIKSDVDLSKLKDEISKTVGAKEVLFSGTNLEVHAIERIKGKTFELSFQKV